MVTTSPYTPAPGFPTQPLPVRHITESDLSWALAEGWKDFRDKRGDLIFAGVLYPVIGLCAAVLARNDQVLPLFFPLVAGLSILGPAVASGFYELARRREEGGDASWWHFLDPLRGRSREGLLLLLTLGLAGLFLLWLAAAWLIYEATIAGYNPVGAGQFVDRLLHTREGWTMIVLGNLAGLVFAIATLLFSVVSFPMVVDKSVDAPTAVATSLRAVQANPKVMASWGLRVAGLLFLGCLPAFIGLAVVLPVLGYATWHLYTRVVQR